MAAGPFFDACCAAQLAETARGAHAAAAIAAADDAHAAPAIVAPATAVSPIPKRALQYPGPSPASSSPMSTPCPLV